MHPELIFADHIPFEEKLRAMFQYQTENEPVYRRFVEALGAFDAPDVDTIPLLPVEAFRDAIIGQPKSAEIYFQSSGTTGMVRSTHYVKDTAIYRESILKGMNYFYLLKDFVVLGYTPGYSENPHSSLIWMIHCLINADETGLSCFLRLGESIPLKKIEEIQAAGKRIMLFGAAFGLMDMAEQFPVQLPEDAIIMETGGMKTHRREVSRDAMHEALAHAFGLPKANVHSEYGMTELLSQAFSDGSMWFSAPPWMRVTIRNPENPLQALSPETEGLIGIIDLANIHSCSFLLTGDKGICAKDGRFQVLGRYEPENLRGCNFLIDDE